MKLKTEMNKVMGGLFIGDGHSASDEKKLLINVKLLII